MPTYLRALFYSAVITGVSTAAHSEQYHVGPFDMPTADFLEMCEGDMAELFCTGYIMGLADGIAIKQAFGHGFEDDAAAVCMPANYSAGQLTRVALKHIESHPEDIHMRASILITAAWRNAWPCP